MALLAYFMELITFILFRLKKVPFLFLDTSITQLGREISVVLISKLLLLIIYKNHQFNTHCTNKKNSSCQNKIMNNCEDGDK